MESFKELACRRRSHRLFTKEKVDENDLRTILRAALMAPSARGERKWHFAVTENPDKISALGAIREHGSQFVAGAPVVIAVLGHPADQDMWIEDGAIAAVSMQYQAEDLGLGSCWCQVRGRKGVTDGVSAEDEVKKILGIEAGWSVLCLIAVGRASDERKVQDEAALKWDQVHFEKF